MLVFLWNHCLPTLFLAKLKRVFLVTSFQGTIEKRFVVNPKCFVNNIMFFCRFVKLLHYHLIFSEKLIFIWLCYMKYQIIVILESIFCQFYVCNCSKKCALSDQNVRFSIFTINWNSSKPINWRHEYPLLYRDIR